MPEKPSVPPMQQHAGLVINDLVDFMNQSINIPRVLLGVVNSTTSGPPPTLTATVHGQQIPSIRYIGSAPTAGKVVVILADGPFYVSLGVLT